MLSSVVVVGAYLLFAAIGGSPDVEDLTTPAELVLSVGTTLGVVALSLSLLVPLRGLRLGLRPALRFPVGAAPRVRRLAFAGVLTLAGQQLVAVVAIRLANDGTPDGTQVVYAAGLTLFLVPWAALAVPLATSAYPGLSERADLGDEAGYRQSLAPVVVFTVVTAAVAAALLVAVSGPMARVFFASGSDEVVAALRDTIVAFAPGLLGYGLVALLTRALYARGLWKAPTVCVVAGWLVAVVADVVLSAALPPEDRGFALGAGHSIGVTVAGIGLLVVVARVAGPAALVGLPRTGAGRAAGRRAGRRGRALRGPPAGRRSGAGRRGARGRRCGPARRWHGARRRRRSHDGGCPRTVDRGLPGAARARPIGRRCTVAEGSPLQGPLRTASPRCSPRAPAGSAVTSRSLLPALRDAGATVTVCGAPATEELFGFTAAGAAFSPVGISAGLAPLADRRRRGAAAPGHRRRRPGARPRPARRAGRRRSPAGCGRRATSRSSLTLHNALPGRRSGRASSGCSGRPSGGPSAAPTSCWPSPSDLAENARRLGAPDVRVAPAFAPPRPPAERSREEVRAELGVDDGRPLVVAVGRLHPQKGYDVLLDAVARVG